MGKEIEEEDFVNPIVKYTLFVFNWLFWLIGALFIGVGAWAFVEKSKFNHQDAEGIFGIIFDVTIVIMSLGVVVFLVAFTGWVGAVRENVCLLRTFYIIIGLMFFLETVGAMLAFIFAEDIQGLLRGIITDEGIPRYREDANLQDITDWFQETFDCCGVGSRGYLEWNDNRYFNCSDISPSPEKCSVPFSCCKEASIFDDQVRNIQCGFGIQRLGRSEAEEIIYTRGCFQAVLDEAKNNLYIIGGIAVAFAIPQLIAIFLARTLVNQIQNTRDAYAYVIK